MVMDLEPAGRVEMVKDDQGGPPAPDGKALRTNYIMAIYVAIPTSYLLRKVLLLNNRD